MADTQKEKTEFTEQEQEQRDKLLHKLLTTPPKPRPKRDRTDKNVSSSKAKE